MKSVFVVLFFVLSFLNLVDNSASASVSVFDYDRNVLIKADSISIPPGKILLIQRNGQYCALIFRQFWIARSEDDTFNGKRVKAYAQYRCWCIENGIGNFSGAECREDELVYPWFKGMLTPAGKREIRCGSTRLAWLSGTKVHMFRWDQNAQSDIPDILKYGVKLAPTPWKNISDVDLNDTRIRWYGYDQRRETRIIPIDELWPSSEKDEH